MLDFFGFEVERRSSGSWVKGASGWVADLHKDAMGKEYFHVPNLLSSVEGSHSFNNSYGDLLSMVKQGFIHTFLLYRKESEVGEGVADVRYYLDQDYGNEILASYLPTFEEPEVFYALKIETGSKGSLILGENGQATTLWSSDLEPKVFLTQDVALEYMDAFDDEVTRLSEGSRIPSDAKVVSRMAKANASYDFWSSRVIQSLRNKDGSRGMPQFLSTFATDVPHRNYQPL